MRKGSWHCSLSPTRVVHSLSAMMNSILSIPSPVNKVDVLPVDFLQQNNKKDNHNFNVGKNYPL
jgi:hypothetical protein